MNNENPFKKGSLASRFYEIDKFLSKPAVKNSSSFAKGTFGVLSSILEIVFIFIKLIFQILWIITLGMLISSFLSR